jgi:hypothetical protein
VSDLQRHILSAMAVRVAFAAFAYRVGWAGRVGRRSRADRVCPPVRQEYREFLVLLWLRLAKKVGWGW